VTVITTYRLINFRGVIGREGSWPRTYIAYTVYIYILYIYIIYIYYIYLYFLHIYIYIRLSRRHLYMSFNVCLQAHIHIDAHMNTHALWCRLHVPFYLHTYTYIEPTQYTHSYIGLHAHTETHIACMHCCDKSNTLYYDTNIMWLSLQGW